MARYTDLDLTFIPNPSAHERITGIGTISYMNGSAVITGERTEFTRSLSIDYNLYVSNTFIGKIKSIETDESLTLYSPVSISGSTNVYDTYDVNRYDYNIVSTIFTAFSTEYKFLVKSQAAITEGTSLRFDIITNCPLFVDPRYSTRLSNFNDPYIPVHYNIHGIDRYDVAGEYIRDTSNPFIHNISDPLSGTLSFSPLYDYSEDGVYYGYLEFQTTMDNEVEVMERAFIDIEIEGIVMMSSNNNFTFSMPADIVVKNDINAIKNSLKHIVRTAKYERLFQPELGTDVPNLLFDYNSAYNMMVKRSIEISISEYEPRVQLEEVRVNITETSNYADISIKFTYLDSQEPYTFNVTLERTR